MGEDITYEEHVALNNMRLNSIRNSLCDVATFAQACSELTKWCSDQRAFTAHFEDNLMSTLQVAMENGTKELFDFELTHQLMSACFSHRKHLSKISANRINRWYEQLRRMKKNGGKRKRAPPKSTISPSSVSTNSSHQNAPMVSENNNVISAVDDTGTTMWGANGGAPGGAPPQGYPPPYNQGMLPYGQMEGNAQMYDHQQQQQQRMLAARQQHMMQPQHRGYPMPMGANHVPGQAHPLMRMPSQMAPPPYAHLTAQHHHQMVRGAAPPTNAPPPPPMMYGSMSQKQHIEYMQMMHAEVCITEKMLIEEFMLDPGSIGTTVAVTEECLPLLETPQYDVLFTTWMPTPTNADTTVSLFINNTPVINSSNTFTNVLIKQWLKSSNLFQIAYQSREKLHRMSCEFVSKKTVAQIRHELFNSTETGAQRTMNARHRMLQIAQSLDAGFVSIPLHCQLSGSRMLNPARHRQCTVSNCFELVSLLAKNPNTTRYFCQYCNSWYKVEDIEIDFFVGQLLHQFGSAPHITHISLDRNNVVKAIEAEKEEKPKKQGGKKRAGGGAPATTMHHDENAHTIRRVKSEVKVDMVYQQQQQQQYWESSPSKTPIAHPLSVGLCSPRAAPGIHPQQGVMMEANGGMIGGGGGSGSAPYTPVSVGGGVDKTMDVLCSMENIEFYGYGKLNLIDNEEAVRQFLQTTKDVTFDDVDLKCLDDPLSTAQLIHHMAPPSSNFTPPWDDLHHLQSR